MSNLKRYEPCTSGTAFIGMYEIDAGDWVKFDDIKDLRSSTDVQQLKPKMPSYEETYQGFCAVHGGIGINETVSEVLESFYEYIARYFGR